MRNYWSCSKFADWLRGTNKPGWGTGKEWADWKKTAKQNHPIRYWLAEEVLNNIQNVVNFIPDKFSNIRYYINNRWVDKTHYLRTGLEPGKWHEFNERLIHGMFCELVDFVEVEAAWHNVIWDKEASAKFSPPWWRNWYRVWRNPESGIDYFNWSAKLVKNEDWGVMPGEEGYGEPTSQALNALKTIELYHWWTVVRPARPDPYEASGWSKYCSTNRNNDFWDLETTPEENAHVRSMLDTIKSIEAQYEDEDTEKMVELVKLRQSLWT